MRTKRVVLVEMSIGKYLKQLKGQISAFESNGIQDHFTPVEDFLINAAQRNVVIDIHDDALDPSALGFMVIELVTHNSLIYPIIYWNHRETVLQALKNGFMQIVSIVSETPKSTKGNSLCNGGFERKYLISKADGTEVDPDANYFVLRLDKDSHALAALHTYARSVRNVNPEFSDDLKSILKAYHFKSKPIYKRIYNFFKNRLWYKISKKLQNM